MGDLKVTGSLVAVDVGGTAIKAVVTDLDGRILSRHHLETNRVGGPQAVVETVLRAIDDLVSRTAGDARAVGLAVPGIVDEAAGIAVDSENIGWANIPFRDLVRERTGLPVGFGHDVRTGGLAEQHSGAGQETANLLFLPVGTGISGAMFVDSKLIGGMYAGEIGHIDVGSGLACACGAIGCLETVSTGPSTVRRFVNATGIRIVGTQEIVERMRAGDPVAAAVWAETVDALALALTTYISLLAPELIVVGGGLSNAGPALIDRLRDNLYARLAWQQRPRIARAQHGDYAAAIGAGLLARRALVASEHGLIG